MRGALIDRRDFVKAAGAAFLAGLSPRALFALERSGAVYASAYRGADGGYGMATVSESGAMIDTIALPARAHGMAFSAATGRAVAFARRPGTFAVVTDTEGKAAPVVLTAPQDRHYFGHGCFSPNGRFLYASENDFDANRGMIGVYDARSGFARIGEYPSFGMGTHDLTISDDGGMLIAANGGIETHPDFGRTKLNLDHMEPSLALIDAAHGTLIERHGLPATLRQLSTRHVDVDADGRVWFACQYEGPRNDLPPLIGHFARGEDLAFLSLPEEVTVGLGNYIGAIAVNRRQGLLGVTSPVGGMAVTIDPKDGSVIDMKTVRDAAGIAPSADGFAVSSYGGDFLDRRSTVAWDQHIVRLSQHG